MLACLSGCSKTSERIGCSMQCAPISMHHCPLLYATTPHPACAVPRRPHPAAAAAAGPLLMLLVLPLRSCCCCCCSCCCCCCPTPQVAHFSCYCCCRSAHIAAAAPLPLRCRWDAKTLTNIALWAGLFPYAIYRGCIAEVRLGCPGREHACVPSSCWLEARASQRCKAPVPYPWRLCRTPLAAASQFI